MSAADLHARLTAKITAHMERAQAAAKDWPSIVGIVEGDPPSVAPDRAVDHIAANDPAHVIRACRADLERLAEHAPPEQDDGPIHWTSCRSRTCRMPWPCAEIRRLAQVWRIDSGGADIRSLR